MASPPWTGGSSIFEIDLDRAASLIRSAGIKLVGLQAPEGLKRSLPSIARQIEERTGAEVIISGDPCYGACDVDLELCDQVELLLHLGHAEIGEDLDKVLFLETRMACDLKEGARKAIPLLRSKRIGIVTTVQHIHLLNGAAEVLRERGIEVLVGGPKGRARCPGQVLGCCYSTARSEDAEEFLFIGTGRFHPVGVAIATKKRVIASDPVTGEVAEVDPGPMLKSRLGAIARAAYAKQFAILVSKKQGQRRMDLARHIKEMGEAKGREMTVVFLDNIEPDRLLNLGADAAISTACPRIALDDSRKFSIPILTPVEFEILQGDRQWDDYIFDEME